MESSRLLKHTQPESKPKIWMFGVTIFTFLIILICTLGFWLSSAPTTDDDDYPDVPFIAYNDYQSFKDDDYQQQDDFFIERHFTNMYIKEIFMDFMVRHNGDYDYCQSITTNNYNKSFDETYLDFISEPMNDQLAKIRKFKNKCTLEELWVQKPS